MILLAQSNVVEGVMLAVLGLVIGWLLLRTHRQLARRRRMDVPLVRVARPEEGEQGHGLQAPPDVVRWEVQMHEMARGLSAQLDSKMGALQALIAEADRAAARLEAAARSAEPGGQIGWLGLCADGTVRASKGMLRVLLTSRPGRNLARRPRPRLRSRPHRPLRCGLPLPRARRTPPATRRSDRPPGVPARRSTCWPTTGWRPWRLRVAWACPLARSS